MQRAAVEGQAEDAVALRRNVEAGNVLRQLGVARDLEAAEIAHAALFWLAGPTHAVTLAAGLPRKWQARHQPSPQFRDLRRRGAVELHGEPGDAEGRPALDALQQSEAILWQGGGVHGHLHHLPHGAGVALEPA